MLKLPDFEGIDDMFLTSLKVYTDLRKYLAQFDLMSTVKEDKLQLLTNQLIFEENYMVNGYFPVFQAVLDFLIPDFNSFTVVFPKEFKFCLSAEELMTKIK